MDTNGILHNFIFFLVNAHVYVIGDMAVIIDDLNVSYW